MLRTGWANLTHTHTHTHTHTPSPDCPVRTQPTSASQTLAQDSLFPLLTPISSLGPLEEGGSSSDRTTLTAHQPEPDTFLKAEPGRSQCSLLSLRSFLNMSFPFFSSLNISSLLLSRFPFVQVTHSSRLVKTWIPLNKLPKTNS